MCSAIRMLLTISSAVHFKEIITKYFMAVLSQLSVRLFDSPFSCLTYLTGETVWVAFLLRIRFNILPFDTSVAVLAQRAIELMIVSVAIRVIAKNVKVCRSERSSASLADKTVPVIASREQTVL